MKERILVFLQNENKSYAQFAEEIGVQPSGISHILSGRNNPSLDFIVKMLLKYPSLSADWLLFGRGAMHKYVSQPTLFDTEPQIEADNAVLPHEGINATHVTPDVPEGAENAPVTKEIESQEVSSGHKRLTRVMFFYSDKSFSEYRPE
jgi:transcriptional regulator with XRE-family HTH domain